MPATKLLVLGAVRIFQPVHGYFVRRELLSWHAEQWAHLNPGSVYNALRTLTRDGYLEEVGTEARGGRPARTSYRLTADGETEFLVLLRDALWNVDPFAPDDLLAAWSFSWSLERQEVLAALDHRLEQIRGCGQAMDYKVKDLLHNPGTPPHVAEHMRLTRARLEGEAAWIRRLRPRIREGEYWFAGESGPPWEAAAAAGASPAGS